MLTTPCECVVRTLIFSSLTQHPLTGSPWDEDKSMMGRWGLVGMGSFEQPNVARKEGAKLEERSAAQQAARVEASGEVQASV